MKDYARQFYKSKAWKKARELCLQKNNFICERCSEAAIVVHHREYITPDNISDVSITLEQSNLEALCMDCHNREHMGKYNDLEEGLGFDEDGYLIRVSVPHCPTG